MSEGFRGLLGDLLALPMPTVAAVTGHAAAASCALALAHDYVIMRASRGFLYMSEVDADIKIVDYFGEVFRQKVPDAATTSFQGYRLARGGGIAVVGIG
jgi:enoyl-CoA hydratase/carnithine racemase